MTTSDKELKSLLALVYSPGWYGRLILRVIEALGSASAVLAADASQLQRFYISDELAASRLSLAADVVSKAFDWQESPQQHIISWHHPYYPARLKTIAAPPPLLFVRGDPLCLTLPQIAIVGSRNPTPVGLSAAAEFSAALSRSGLVVTSGLAVGIDGVSHQAALSAGGQTIAVLGGGLNRLYPPRHRQLAQAIAVQGAVITEFPLDSPPRREYFPQRNRVISGLSLGVLVVEATLRSGSLITARFANEQGREVFAIPGALANPLARGCHALIQEGAKLVTGVEDILEEIAGQFTPLPSSAAVSSTVAPYKILTPLQDTLLKSIGYSVTAADLIIERSQIAAAEVLSALTHLEIEGLIQAVPGGFMRLQLPSLS